MHLELMPVLRSMGLQCYMVTGDNWTTARIVAAELGIINVMAEVLPAGKADKVGPHHIRWEKMPALMLSWTADCHALSQDPLSGTQEAFLSWSLKDCVKALTARHMRTARKCSSSWQSPASQNS